jgi:aspartate/methionine/tyrosine aminotransferase
MEKIARVVERHEGVFLISDEIYEHIIFTGEHVSMASFDLFTTGSLQSMEYQKDMQ